MNSDEEDLLRDSYEFYHHYKNIIQLLHKIGFEKSEKDSNIWFFKNYYFTFIHSINGNSGYYDTLYLNRVVNADYYQQDINKYKGIKLVSMTNDNNGEEAYELSYFEEDIHYRIDVNDLLEIKNRIISKLRMIFKTELRKIVIKKLYE